MALRNFVEGENAQKFHCLIYANKAINLIRDPISTLKHHINMKRYNDKSARYFSLGADLNAIFPKLVGYTTNNGGGGQSIGMMPDLNCASIGWILDTKHFTILN